MTTSRHNIAGIDLSKSQSYYCVMDCLGSVIKHGMMKTDPLAFEKQFSDLDKTAVEITATSRIRWIERLLTALGHEVTWRGVRIGA